MHIALCAMSGIRVCDHELLAVGLTLPGFVERSEVIANLPSLGLLTLAGATPPEHDVTYHEAAEAADRAHLPERPDLVAISSLSAQIHEAYDVADAYRARGVPVVLGGLHVSAVPEEAAAHADAIVVGQAEGLWPEVVADASAGRLRPRYVAEPTATPLRADPPWPRWDLLASDRYHRLTIQTCRGCPHRCSFCGASPTISSRYQQKSVERVVAEVDQVCARWPRPFIEFADDNGLVDRAWWKRFLPHLTERRLSWFTETDIAVADDEDLLDLMHASGCRQVLIGLESPAASDLARIETRGDWKARRAERYHAAIAAIQGRGITVNGCFILGLDEHGPDCFERIEAFIRETALYEVQLTLLTPFPGTDLYRRLEREGRLLAPGDWRGCTLFDVCFEPRQMSAQALRTGFRHLVQRVYAPQAIAARRKAFCRHWRQTRPSADVARWPDAAHPLVGG